MRKPTPIQHYILRRMAGGWTLLCTEGATMLRDNRDATRKSVAGRTAQALSDGGWITRTYVTGRGMRWKITAAGKLAVDPEASAPKTVRGVR